MAECEWTRDINSTAYDRVIEITGGHDKRPNQRIRTCFELGLRRIAPFESTWSDEFDATHTGPPGLAI